MWIMGNCWFSGHSGLCKGGKNVLSNPARNKGSDETLVAQDVFFSSLDCIVM